MRYFDKVLEINPNNIDALNSKNDVLNELNNIGGPQDDEFRLYSNELFSVNYPLDWEYQEFNYLDEPNVVFQDKNNPNGDVVQIATYKTEGTTLDDLLSNITHQIKQNFSNRDIQPIYVNKDNIYLGNYPALKFTAKLKLNSEFNYFKKQQLTEYTTITNDKQYVIMLLSNARDYADSDQIFERMVSSFDIFPIEKTKDDKVLEINPNDIEALYNKGLRFAELGNYNEAIGYFDKVLELNPNNIDAVNSKNDALNKIKNR